jgi:hypothetical protein
MAGSANLIPAGDAARRWAREEGERALLTALHCRALATVVQRGEGHLFMRKYALFASGRRPLGVRDGVLCLF